MKHLLAVILLVFFLGKGHSATVDTVSIYSRAMHRSFSCVVIQPGMDQDKPVRVPVVYLLHGYSGNYSNWIAKVPELKTYADNYRLMIVCPDGGFSSWYFDSPVDTAMRYETYIAEEVPAWIDAHYFTINDRRARAITGLSMGGHGGLFLGLRHTERFGACGSMSGGVNLDCCRTRFDISKRIGDTIAYAANWKDYSVSAVAERYAATKAATDSLGIIIDCGTEDFFYADNHALHEKMLRLHIPHEYTERPGKHDWTYWSNAVQYQLLYFRNYFSRRLQR
ncbi:MAG: alpha/beta hydrolase family protein [Chitinophagaceae bacterium]